MNPQEKFELVLLDGTFQNRLNRTHFIGVPFQGRAIILSDGRILGQTVDSFGPANIEGTITPKEEIIFTKKYDPNTPWYSYGYPHLRYKLTRTSRLPERYEGEWQAMDKKGEIIATNQAEMIIIRPLLPTNDPQLS